MQTLVWCMSLWKVHPSASTNIRIYWQTICNPVHRWVNSVAFFTRVCIARCPARVLCGHQQFNWYAIEYALCEPFRTKESYTTRAWIITFAQNAWIRNAVKYFIQTCYLIVTLNTKFREGIQNAKMMESCVWLVAMCQRWWHAMPFTSVLSADCFDEASPEPVRFLPRFDDDEAG